MLQSTTERSWPKVYAPEHKIAPQIQRRPPMPHQARHESIPSSAVVSESAGRKRRSPSTRSGFPTSVPRQNMPKTRVFPLIPTCSRLLEGGGGGPHWLNLPTSTQPNPTESRQVTADRCSKKSELPERSMVLHGIYCRSLNAEQRTPKAPEGKSEYLGISRIFPSFG